MPGGVAVAFAAPGLLFDTDVLPPFGYPIPVLCLSFFALDDMGVA